MNITELARKLKITPEILRTKLPELGFDIGMRALKVDDRLADRIVEKWRDYEKLEREKSKWQEKIVKEEKAKEIREQGGKIKLPPKITVRDFATRLNMPVTRVIRELMNNGILATLNDYIDFETATIISEDFGFKVRSEEGEAKTMEEKMEIVRPDEGNTPRPPVIVVMGHVDHGKSKLLEAIRQVEMLSKEAGGITQHIGAYMVEKKGQKITFIDTPGHEAFTTMRSRGARIADIAILVVAADDGVQPQTREALKIIRAAKLPFAVAINKIDKPDINLEKLKSQLAEIGLTPEEWGGQTPMVQISAKTGKNIDQLLETLLLIYELEKENILAKADRRAIGTVIESHVDTQEGNSVTILVQNGTLRTGDYIVHGNLLLGKVRSMRDWNGREIREVPPSMPAKILGFRALPDIGDIIHVPENPDVLEKKPKAIKRASHAAPVSVTRAAEEGKILLNVIIKADVLGSLEAVVSSLEKVGSDKMGVKIVSHGLGNINENDVTRAEAGNARIYGFHVLAPLDIETEAREKNVQVKLFEIIYDLIDAVRSDLDKLVPEEMVLTYLGRLRVKGIFRTEKGLQIVGGVVTDGKLKVGGKLRIMRMGNQIGEGKIEELQAGKKAVNDVPAGSECGLKVKTRTKMLLDDELEVYWEEKRRQAL